MPIKLATVFSGIGAIEFALKRLKLDHEIVFACDIDKFVKESYVANYDISEEFWFEDIAELDGNQFYGKVDLLVGGSPCQSFSVAGNQKGLDDERGSLINQFIRLIEEIKPRIFIFENVRGLIFNNKGNTWKQIMMSFEKAGYSVKYSVMSAKNYGMPQSRERLFAVGFAKEKEYLAFEFPEHKKRALDVQDLLQDNFDRINMIKDNRYVDTTKLKHSYGLENYTLSKPKIIDPKYFLSEKVKNYVLAGGSKSYYIEPKVNPTIALPLLATMHKMHRAGIDNYFEYEDKLRRLTPRECLRLMGFDDRFKIVVSDTQLYRQAGNSIVVDVLMQITKNLTFTSDEKI